MYCLDSEPQYGISDARVIILENIRQKCIHLISYDTEVDNKEKKMKYWDYMENFYKDCLLSNKFNSACANETMLKANIKIKEVDDCIIESFGLRNLIYN